MYISWGTHLCKKFIFSVLVPLTRVDERKSAKAIQPQKPLEQQTRPHTNNSKTPMSLYAQVIKTSATITIPQNTSITEFIIDKTPRI